jgi:predicted PurR-regulated permease PerM
VSGSASKNQPLTLRTYAILAITVAVAAVFFGMVQIFLLDLFLAAVFSAMAYPIFDWIASKVGGRRVTAAALTILLLIAAVLLPGTALLMMVAEQANEVGQHAMPWVEEQFKNPSEPRLDMPAWMPFHEQLRAWMPTIVSKLGELSSKVGELAVVAISSLTTGAAQFLLDLFVMLYAMFYFLVQGPTLLDGLKRYALSLAGIEDRVFQRAVVVSRATVKGTLIIGIVQGALGGLGFWIFGIKGAAFWGGVMFLASMLPVVGTALVWIPGVIFLVAAGETTPALGLAIWSAIIVGNIDNFLRPILIGGDAEMPDLLVLISTFGGLAMFGAVGLIVGPVLAAVTLTLLEILHETLSAPEPTPRSAATGPSVVTDTKPPSKPMLGKGGRHEKPGLLGVRLSRDQQRELELLEGELAQTKAQIRQRR